MTTEQKTQTGDLTRRWLGKWWLPGQPDKPIHGELRVDNSLKLTLTLQGILVQASANAKFSLAPIILGESITGDIMTLENCLETGGQTANKDVLSESQVLTVRFALMGRHYPTAEEVGENRLDVKLTTLQEFINKREIRFREGTKKGDTIVEHDLPDDILVSSSQDPFRMTFNALFAPGAFSVSLQQTTKAVFSKASRISLREHSRLIQSLTDFLAFVSQMKTTVTNACYTIPRTDTNDFGKEIAILSSDYNPFAESKAKAYKMLFTLPDIGPERFTGIWDRWCTLEKDFRPVLHYYLHEVTEHTPYVFTSILNLSRALEVYHRQSTGQKNRKNSDRVKDVWEKQPACIKAILGEKDSFASQTVEARDHHTHYDKPYDQDLESEVILCGKLKVLLTSILLGELGFSHNEVEKIAQTKARHFLLPTVVK